MCTESTDCSDMVVNLSLYGHSRVIIWKFNSPVNFSFITDHISPALFYSWMSRTNRFVLAIWDKSRHLSKGSGWVNGFNVSRYYEFTYFSIPKFKFCWNWLFALLIFCISNRESKQQLRSVLFILHFSRNRGDFARYAYFRRVLLRLFKHI